MVHATPIKFFLEQQTPVRALSSLTRRDADAVRAAVRVAGSPLAVEEHDDYDGYLSLLLTVADPAEPSYLIAGRTNAVELARLEGDDMTVVGTFAGIGAAMLKLRSIIERPTRRDVAPPPPTVATVVSLAAELLARHGDDANLHAAMRADAAEGFMPVLRAVDVINKLPRQP